MRDRAATAKPQVSSYSTERADPQDALLELLEALREVGAIHPGLAALVRGHAYSLLCSSDREQPHREPPADQTPAPAAIQVDSPVDTM